MSEIISLIKICLFTHVCFVYSTQTNTTLCSPQSQHSTLSRRHWPDPRAASFVYLSPDPDVKKLLKHIISVKYLLGLFYTLKYREI